MSYVMQYLHTQTHVFVLDHAKNGQLVLILKHSDFQVACKKKNKVSYYIIPRYDFHESC